MAAAGFGWGSQNGKSNFVFTVKWPKLFSNLQGNPVLVFRSASPSYATVPNPTGLVDIQVKTSGLIGIGLVQSTNPYTVQVTAKANVQITDAVSEAVVGGFGSTNNTNFIMVVIDGTPLGNPDKY